MSGQFSVVGEVVAYIRCSTVGQSEKHSLGQQRSQIRRWAESNGAKVVAFYEDWGVSGTVWDREGLNNCVEHAKKKQMNIIVTKLDRFSRDPVHAALLERQLNAAGVEVISLADEGNGDEPHHQLVRGILRQIAAFEAAQAGARTKAALAHLKRKGIRLGRAPKGFERSGDGFVPSKDYDWLKLLIIMRNEQKKSLAEVAATCGCSVSFASKLASRWPSLRELEKYRKKVIPSEHSIQGQSGV